MSDVIPSAFSDGAGETALTEFQNAAEAACKAAGDPLEMLVVIAVTSGGIEVMMDGQPDPQTALRITACLALDLNRVIDQDVEMPADAATAPVLQ